MNNNRKGFTLIELLVVVMIIGILASIAIPQYFKVVEKARVAEAMSVISSIKSAEERYLARGGSYTANLNELDISYSNQTNAAVITKFFNASVTGAGACNGTPCYLITVKRHTNSSTVADRYSTYSLNSNVPLRAQVQPASASAALNELVD